MEKDGKNILKRDHFLIVPLCLCGESVFGFLRGWGYLLSYGFTRLRYEGFFHKSCVLFCVRRFFFFKTFSSSVG